MADEQSKQQAIADFSRNRDQLISISSQKQQYLMQSATLKMSLDELEKTSEKKVFKAVGNILVSVTTDDAKKELADQKETVDLRIKTLQKQEDATIQKLNKLKSDIEGQGQSDETQKPASKSKK
ncbi:MAG: prefoldin subunit [Candidatus Diapherotrites archaeon]|uniref:Prefoldin subunit n=1 Tax=Candidatus Iainarchaeum sp. TaxID=3101447 RepID=A0A8T4L5D9_9ARCH|nr:prefoldin subunit [Candidatus Diapherotrites archaeon]